MREIEQVLAQVPLFASLPRSELEYLAAALRIVQVAPGALLFREGEYGDHFYAILAGQLQVIKALGTPEEVLAGVRGPGEFVGEMSLLPRWLPQVAGFDFGAQIAPMRAVGGGFYDFIPLDGQMLGIAIGDVSGHGVPAALFMALTVTLLRAEACRTCSPAEVLRGVNRQLLNLNHEGMFVTLLYGVLNCATHEFTYARAGHEPPILCRTGGEWLDADPELECGQLLGLFDDPLLCERTLTLPPGGTLLLYTDGVTETMNSQSELFGGERLLAAVCAHRNSHAQAVCERIWKLVTAHRGDAAQRDDITVVCAQAG